MALGAKSRVGLSVAETVLWNASSTQEHQSDLTLCALAGNVCDTSNNFSDTLIVYVELEARSACNTNALGIILDASWSTQSLNIIITRAALATHNSIKRTTVINRTQPIGIQPVPSDTSSTFPSRSVKISTLIRHTVFICQLKLRLTLLALVVQVIKRQAIDHVAQVGELIEEVACDALDAWVVLVGECTVLELAGFVWGQVESSLAFEAYAYVCWAVRCTVFGNART
jgi:hypothetical protein